MSRRLFSLVEFPVLSIDVVDCIEYLRHDSVFQKSQAWCRAQHDFECFYSFGVYSSTCQARTAIEIRVNQTTYMTNNISKHPGPAKYTDLLKYANLLSSGVSQLVPMRPPNDLPFPLWLQKASDNKDQFQRARQLGEHGE